MSFLEKFLDGDNFHGNYKSKANKILKEKLAEESNRWTKVALGQVFSENFGFPCQSTFHLLLHNHLLYHPRLAQ
jgi:hypothetical protein